ncbi:MAG TPA: prolyl oligopeptidase family serine peptidase [Vicinamibacterales bacterium]|nr:prolyl oligopeptidase family serine peptidase [Vicinamibacterales bacterium]
MMICTFLTSVMLAQAPAPTPAYKTIDIAFRSQDGQELFGKLTVPDGIARAPVVMMIQTAEAQTADSRVQGPRGPIDFFDLYRRELAAMGVAFFSYEGRGIRLGDKPPRYVAIDRPLFNTATLERKVQDAMAAVRTLKGRPDIDGSRVLLTGVSEGTLLAAETATRMPRDVKALVLSSVVTDMREAIKFMMTDGAFLQHQQFWDANNDARITAEEFEADRRGVRRAAKLEFSSLDVNGDGVYTPEDRQIVAKSLLAAADAGDADTVWNGFLKVASSLELPDGWLKDHFAHPGIWTFLSQLDMPVGMFHGELDGNTPVVGVRGLERQAMAAGKTKFEFHYFAGEEHSLGGLDFFLKGAPSDGYKELFAFVKRQIAP